MDRREEVKDLLARSHRAIAAKQGEIRAILILALGSNATDADLEDAMNAQIDWWSEHGLLIENRPRSAIDGLLREHHRLRMHHLALLKDLDTIRKPEPALPL